MTCVRCNGRVMRQFDEYACINCGAEQTPGAAVELAAAKNMSREASSLISDLHCKCGASISKRSVTGLCPACFIDSRPARGKASSAQRRLFGDIPLKPVEPQYRVLAKRGTEV